MRRLLPLFALVIACVVPAVAGAAPTVEYVRIEGRTTTLFEGPILTDGRNVQAVSERSTGAIRRCDGTNGGAGGAVRPVPTAAAVDAMSIVGQGFDGRWYPDINDYFIRAFGADAQGGGAYWGLFVDGTSSDVGGCQGALGANQSVLWAYDAFRRTTQLTLAAPQQPVNAGTPVSVTVGRQAGSAALNTMSISSVPAAAVSSVDASGAATVTFPSDGWYRLKADGPGAVRSNRQDVCVGSCGPAPADTLVRTPPAPVFYGPGGTPLANSPALATATKPLALGRVTAGSSAYRRARIAVRWSIARQGPGLLRWSIGADDLSTKARRYVVRARGTNGSSALVRLPAGRSYALRFTSVDRLRNTDSADAGRVVVPIDDRAKGIRRAGRWSKAKASTAWSGTVLRGRPGSRFRVKLAPGRPTVLLRGRRAGAVLRVTAGHTTRTLRVHATRRNSHQLVTAFRRARAGVVTVRVVRGAVDLDGVAVRP